MKAIFVSLVLVFSPLIYGATHLPEIKGPDLISGKNVSAFDKTKKGTVVVFLSAVCPCSDSHLAEIASLAKDFPEFSFVGVHSNTDEAPEKSKSYFEAAKLPFPVVQDEQAKMADQYKAFKTPHAFILDQQSQVVYQGGVSSTRHFTPSAKKYLREALEDLQNSRTVKMAESRTLGCVISRGEKFVW